MRMSLVLLPGELPAGPRQGCWLPAAAAEAPGRGAADLLHPSTRPPGEQETEGADWPAAFICCPGASLLVGGSG